MGVGRVEVAEGGVGGDVDGVEEVEVEPVRLLEVGVEFELVREGAG